MESFMKPEFRGRTSNSSMTLQTVGVSYWPSEASTSEEMAEVSGMIMARGQVEWTRDVFSARLYVIGQGLPSG